MYLDRVLPGPSCYGARTSGRSPGGGDWVFALASVLQAASPRGIPTFASAYGNPRPPSWMTPNSCAGGLPGFDPSGFKLGDVDVKPKFKFNLGKIKFKF